MSNSDRLLEGEDPDTTDREEAEHWLGVYRELLGFKNELVGEAESGSTELPPAAQPIVEEDRAALEAQRRRLLRRHAFWRDRVAELRKA